MTGRWIVSTSSAAPLRRPARGVGAHAACVGTDVAVADPLVVARQGKRERVAPVDEREDRELLALEKLLDHELLAECRDRAQRRVELVLRPADEHPLARREPVGLDDAGRPRDGHRLRERHAGSAHDVLREALRALDLRGRRARPEDRDAAAAQLVGDAGDERRLRPDHDEVGAERPRQLEQALAVLRADRVALTDPGDARVPGSRMDLLDRRALRELPGKRMLPPAGADDEDFHAAQAYFRARAWESELEDASSPRHADPRRGLSNLVTQCYLVS